MDTVEIKVTPINEKVKMLLQRQISVEQEASQLYLAFSKMCEIKQYIGAKSYFEKQSLEEREHMDKVLNYLIDKDCTGIKLAKADEVLIEPICLYDILVKYLEAEKKVTASWKQVVEVSLSEKDFTSFTFSQWFVEEQISEEAKASNLIRQHCTFGILGDMIVDKEMGK